MGGGKGEQEEKRKGYLWLACKINEKELIKKKSSSRKLHAQGIPKNIHTKLYSKAQPQKRQDIEKEYFCQGIGGVEKLGLLLPAGKKNNSVRILEVWRT